MSISIDNLRVHYKKEVEIVQQLQKDIRGVASTRQQLIQQLNENGMVLEELNRAGEEGNVYKMIGPALIKQDLVEAKANVSKRLEYIKKEMDKLENQLKVMESKSADKQQEVMKIQKNLQAAAAAAVAPSE